MRLIMILLFLFPGVYLTIRAAGIHSTSNTPKDTNIFIKHFEPLKADQFIFSQSHQKRDQVEPPKSALHLSFNALGRLFEIQLFRHQSVYSSHAHLQIISSEGIKSQKNFTYPHLYQGFVKDEPSSHVHGCIINGSFDGVIRLSNESFYIEPAWNLVNTSSPYESIIYRESDIIYPWSFNFTSYADNEKDKKSDSFDRLRDIQYSKHVDLNTSTRIEDLFDSLNIDYLHARYGVRMNRSDSSMNSKKSNPEPKSFEKKQRDEGKKKRRPEPINQSSKRASTVRTCSLHVVVDYPFYAQAGKDLMRALAEVAYHVEETDTVYRGTDFNGNGIGDNVGISIAAVTIFETAEDENYILSDKMVRSDDYLAQFALYNFDAYCMGLVYTSIDFDGGVLGLAWVSYADPHGPPGGICQKRIIYREDYKPSSLNTALISNVNHGWKVPKPITAITTMHELGHAFGSLHDPDTHKCSPGGDYGNYIMFPQATNGDKPFNVIFSPCSRSRIAPVIASKGPLCFEYHSGPYCGNQLTEEDEECDCGTVAQCTLNDKCCTPQGGMGHDKECTLMRHSGSVCSPYSSSCCTEDCQIEPASAKHVCEPEGECTQKAYCNGESLNCPDPPHKRNGTYCGRGKACLNGICQLGICSTLGLPECSCEKNKFLCHICCEVDGKCKPVPKSKTGEAVMYQPVGSACNNYTGYCDVDGQCIIVDGDSALDRMRELFTKEGVDDIKEWLAVNWYYIIAVGQGAVFVTAFTIIVKRRMTKESKRMTRRAARLAAVWREARRQKAVLATERQRVLDSHCSLDSAEEISWLHQLFPSADVDIVEQAIKSSDTEKEAVLRLVAMGFGIRKLAVQ